MSQARTTEGEVFLVYRYWYCHDEKVDKDEKKVGFTGPRMLQRVITRLFMTNSYAYVVYCASLCPAHGCGRLVHFTPRRQYRTSQDSHYGLLLCSA